MVMKKSEPKLLCGAVQEDGGEGRSKSKRRERGQLLESKVWVRRRVNKPVLDNSIDKYDDRRTERREINV